MSLRNFDIILDTLRVILKHQNAASINHTTTDILLKDPTFIKNIIATADRLVEIYFNYEKLENTAITDHQFYSLISIINDYGILLAEIHENVSFLKPFYFYGQKLGMFNIKDITSILFEF